MALGRNSYHVNNTKINLIMLRRFLAAAGMVLAIGMTASAQQATTFTRGADVSWCSEMEADGMKFYSTRGEETDIFQLLGSIGLNAVRLRVWVNPELTNYGAWSDKADVVAKAVRAKQAGLDVMIDFHYSDYFADPGRQTKPKAWQGKDMAALKVALSDHTIDVLTALKEAGVEPRWVQVGNETTSGMVWDDGRIDWNRPNNVRYKNYVALSNAGYDAVKSVLPDAKVIVHHDNGESDNVWFYKDFKQYGGKFDMIGVSYYPDYDNWQQTNADAQTNLRKLYNEFHVPVMVVETGYSTYNETRAESVMKDLFAKMTVEEGCAGILYWEPEVYGGWSHLLDDQTGESIKHEGQYGTKVVNNGAFTQFGRPSRALLAFGEGWQPPVFNGQTQPLSEQEQVYIYNTESKLFLTEGNDWGTHASVGADGLPFMLEKSLLPNGNWDGASYVIKDKSAVKGGWYNMFIQESGDIYMDYAESGDISYTFTGKGDGTYTIGVSEMNTVMNPAHRAGYVMGHYTLYVNQRDQLQTGTGVIFSDPTSFEPGEFNTSWAFVGEEQYKAYESKMVTYRKALELGELIERARAIGVDVTAAQAVYNNTSSTLEQLEAAMAQLEADIIAYYEEHVTPTNPLDMSGRLANTTCDAIGGWINETNCILSTGTWIPDNSDEGSVTGTYVSGWAQDLSGKVYQHVEGLPNGIYQVQMGVLSQKMPMQMFANTNKKNVKVENVFHLYNVITNVGDGTIDLGVEVLETGENWFCVDNPKLMYFGQGVEAYRAWINMLLESAPSFDDAVVQTSLLEEYEGILASVNTAQTKEDILAIIPAYEDVLNRIIDNAAAYAELHAALDDEDEWIADANVYYADIVIDYIDETAGPAYDDHVLGTADVLDIVARMQELKEMVQEFGWKLADFFAAQERLEQTYEQYKDQCSAETAEAAALLIAEVKAFDVANCTTEQIVALLERIYDMEFKLQIPDEPASDENPRDYTAKIQYPSFYDGGTGWNNDGWSTFGSNDWHSSEFFEEIDTHYLNLWNANGGCRAYQVINNLPDGTYCLSMAVYADAEGLQLYAGNQYKDIPAGKNIYGVMGARYEVDVDVVGGQLEIGVRHTGDGALWAIVDNATLTYFGTESQRTGIDEAKNEVKGLMSNMRYNLSGQRVSATSKGIQIMRRTDGSVVKMIVR